MKKIIGLALALAAAALVFVGCSDSTGEGDIKGTKWDTSMYVDATDANIRSEKKYKDGYDFKYRRYWHQLGDNDGSNAVSGITTTVTIMEDGLSTKDEEGNIKNTAVVGLMFDYNDHREGTTTKRDKKDYCLVGVNMYRNTKVDNTASQYYVVKYNGVTYKADEYDENFSLDSHDGDPKHDSNVNLTGTGMGTSNAYSWEAFKENTQWKYAENVKFDKIKDPQKAYQFVIDIKPHFDNDDDVIATGYEVRLGKDVETALKSKPVATYEVDADRLPTKDTDGKITGGINYTKVTVGKGTDKKEYWLPSGGIAVYGNAKTKYSPTKGTDPDGTKIVANYKTERKGITGGKKTSFDTLKDMQNSAVIGDLKLTNTSNDNITVIAE